MGKPCEERVFIYYLAPVGHFIYSLANTMISLRNFVPHHK